MSNQYIQQLIEIRNASGNFLVPISDDPSGTSTLRKITVYNLLSGVTTGGGGSAVWGAITGTLSGQIDLQNALNLKANSSSLGTAAQLNSGNFLQIGNNLADISNVATARTNLGLGTAAILNSGNFLQVANSLADINASTARTNLGLGTAATLNSGNFLQTANNLADVNAATARTNLGLGQVATYNSGQLFYSPTFSGTPTGPTAANGTNTTQLATTAFVTTAITNASGGVTSVAGRTGAVTLSNTDISGLGQAALYNSGTLLYNTPMSGIPTAPTAANGTNTTQVATTQFVTTAITNASGGVTSVAGRTGAVTLSTSDISGLGQAALYNSGTIFNNSPLSGIPTAPTAAYGTNTTQIATTAFVSTLANSVSGGVPSLPAYSHYANSTNSTAAASGIQTIVLGTPGFAMPNGTLLGQLTSNTPNYLQLSLQNTSAASGASSDLILTANNGNDSVWYLDIGINNSSGGVAPFTASGASYIYASDSNELNIGCLGSSGIINFYVNSGVLKAGWFDTNKNLNLNNNLYVTGNTYHTGLTSGTLISGNTIAGGNGYFNTLTVANQVSGTFYGNGAGLTGISASVPASISENNIVISGNPAASTSALLLSGVVFVGGTASTNFPYMLFQQSGTTGASWNTGGTYIGINSPATFAGNYVDIHNNGGTSKFSIDQNGSCTCYNLTTNNGVAVNNGFSVVGASLFQSTITSVYSQASNTSSLALNGTILTTGGGAACLPSFLQSPSAANAVNNWSPYGTCHGINTATFSGNFLDFRIGGGSGSLFSVDYQGITRIPTLVLSSGAITSTLLKTNSSGQVVSAVAGTDYMSPSAITILSNLAISGMPASGQSTLLVSGLPYASLTKSLNVPLLYLTTSGAASSSAWNFNGTYFGINAPSSAGFIGNFIDCQQNGTSQFSVSNGGAVNAAGAVTCLALNAGGGNVSNVNSVSTANLTCTSYITSNYAVSTNNTSVMTLTGKLFTSATQGLVAPMVAIGGGNSSNNNLPWNNSGCYLGINTDNNFSGTLFDCRINGSSGSVFSIDYNGNMVNNSVYNSGIVTIKGSGTPNSSALMLIGPIYSGGTATTTTPLLFINGPGAAAVTTWSNVGTTFGINAQPGFAGNLIDLHTNGGTSVFSVSSIGAVAMSASLTASTISSTNFFTTNRVPSIGQVMFQSTGATGAPSGIIFGYTPGLIGNVFSASGTIFGANALLGFSGNFLDMHVNNANSVFKVDYNGITSVSTLVITSGTINSVMLKTNSSGQVVQAVAGTDYVLPSSTTQYSGQQYIPTVSLASGTTVNWNMNTAPNATLNVPSGAFTLANPTNIQSGAGGMLTFTQPATTASLGVITWGSAYKFPNGTKFNLTAAANAVDDVSWYSPDGTNVHITGLGNFS